MPGTRALFFWGGGEENIIKEELSLGAGASWENVSATRLNVKTLFLCLRKSRLSAQETHGIDKY